MSAQVAVQVCSGDPVSRAGVASQLRDQHDLEILPADASRRADVVVLVADQVDEDTTRDVNVVRSEQDAAAVVLVVGSVDGSGVLAAVEAGVSALVRRTEATADRLTLAIKAAVSGDGHLPPDLLGRLLQQVGRPSQRRSTEAGLTYGGLSQRELTVLRLVAEGYSTREIAKRLSFSERTIKNSIHDMVSRLHLRNRVHAVAFAVRQGLI